MEYEVHGSTMQTLDITMTQGEAVYTESGGMAWMGGDIAMSTNTKGGFMAGLGRKLAGESFFMTTYTCRSSRGFVTFTPEAPGGVLPMELQAGQQLICQKDAFMCAESTVKLEMHFRKKLGTGIFGGEGFILQKVTGPGKVFFEIPGEIRAYTLQAGQALKVDPGHIAAFDASINYDISRVKGVSNILFSGEGLFLATVRGPGRVWLQSLPLSNLAHKLARYLPTSGS
ncbi:MAG: TIGR00266 family protein [Chloroflexota bacterium]|nr:TIGR00266 family protein [Chloroflexota bacterium]